MTGATPRSITTPKGRQRHSAFVAGHLVLKTLRHSPGLSAGMVVLHAYELADGIALVYPLSSEHVQCVGVACFLDRLDVGADCVRRRDVVAVVVEDVLRLSDQLLRAHRQAELREVVARGGRNALPPRQVNTGAAVQLLRCRGEVFDHQ